VRRCADARYELSVSPRRRPAGAVVALAGSGVICLGAAGLFWLGGTGDAVVNAAPFTAATSDAAAPSTGGSTTPTPAVSAPAATGEPSAEGGQWAYEPAIGEPVRVSLPGKQVPLVPVGVLADGSMEIPDDVHTAGWWVGGAVPGEQRGSVVIVGHLDSATQGIGDFAELLNLKQGQRVEVSDADGRSLAYTVTERQQLNKTALPAALFATDSAPRLVLITCGGRFDPVTHYEDNIIVIATPA
jgi:Sortase domain